MSGRLAIGLAAVIACGTVLTAIVIGREFGDAFPAGPYAVPGDSATGCPSGLTGTTFSRAAR